MTPRATLLTQFTSFPTVSHQTCRFSFSKSYLCFLRVTKCPEFCKQNNIIDFLLLNNLILKGVSKVKSHSMLLCQSDTFWNPSLHTEFKTLSVHFQSLPCFRERMATKLSKRWGGAGSTRSQKMEDQISSATVSFQVTKQSTTFCFTIRHSLLVLPVWGWYNLQTGRAASVLYCSCYGSIRTHFAIFMSLTTAFTFGADEEWSQNGGYSKGSRIP